MNGVILKIRKNGKVMYHHSNLNGPEWINFDSLFPIWKNARFFNLTKD